MKLCMSCLEELFDREVTCPNCGGNTLICNKELQQIQLELESATKRKKEKLLLNPMYTCVNNYILTKKKRNEHYPKILKTHNDVLDAINPSYNRIQTTQPTTPTITCPYCKSTNCKKISGLSKAGSIALWGIFALGKTTKQWHCNNCKSDF